MSNEMTDITSKLQQYDEAFDFYMDRGQLPESIPQSDLLGGFISQTIQDNPQLDSQDPIWVEILKDELMKFIEAMLKLFQPIEENHRQEKALIAAFASGETDKKRALWKQVFRTIKAEYKPTEVNIEGYVEQIKNNEDLDDVFASMVKDWEKACDQRETRLKKLTIERNGKAWEHHVKEVGIHDYQQIKKTETVVYSYQALAEILCVIGREQPKREDEMDDTVKRYLPLLPSPPKPAVEIDEVASGNDLSHVLPVELAVMADAGTEDIFYLKYATKKLQLFANKPKKQSVMKVEQQKKKKPRLEKGPIIVSLDTSGSMNGNPIKLAKSLLLQLLRMAKKQKRKCFLITFSVRTKTLDLSRPSSWKMVDKFLENTFTGGTNGEQMLNAALKMLNTSTFGMADVLIISDFFFNIPSSTTIAKMKKEHNKGTRFYGLKIDSDSNNYSNILDKIWTVKIKKHQSFG